MVKNIFDHLLISISGGIMGIILGLGTVLGFEKLIKTNKERTLFLTNRYLVFIPWRTIALAILLFFHTPVYLIILFGLGPKIGIISSLIYIFVLTCIIAVDSFVNICHEGKFFRILSITRTLLVFGILLTYNFGIYGGGGLGFITLQNIQLLNYRRSLELFSWMILLGFLLDILFGIIQFFYIPKTAPETISKES